MTWKWSFWGLIIGYFALHPLIMIIAHLMFESDFHHDHGLLEIIASEFLRSFSLSMLPWGLAFAVISGFIGYFFGKVKKTEEALKENEEKFRNMAEAVQDAMIMMGSKGDISYWNAGAERIFGYTRDQVMGRELHSILVPERYRQAFQERFDKFMKTGQMERTGKTMELFAIRKNSEEFPAELSLSSLKMKGQWCAIGIVRDISLRKYTEQERLEREKLQGVLEMAGAACHEMNQPLQAISGLAEVLSREISKDDPRYRNMKAIGEAVRKMGEITGKIMRITRYETIDYLDGKKIIDIDKASSET